MEKVGVSFYEFIEKISKSETTLFPILRQDALIFQRNVEYMAMSHTTALRKVAETHPNNDFKDIVTNYSAAYNTSGTNTANTMIAATESAFRAMRNSVKSYTSEANSIAQMVLLIMAAMPILAIATTFIATGKDAVSMTIMVMIILPVIISCRIDAANHPITSELLRHGSENRPDIPALVSKNEKQDTSVHQSGRLFHT